MFVIIIICVANYYFYAIPATPSSTTTRPVVPLFQDFGVVQMVIDGQLRMATMTKKTR
jgi:hypothetical protein